jgi:hypothetical protein
MVALRPTILSGAFASGISVADPLGPDVLVLGMLSQST